MPRWTIQSMRDHPSGTSFIPRIAPWVHSAGNPYLDWFFSDPPAARRFVEHALARPAAELSAARVTLLLLEGEPVGGYVALTGAELRLARRADALASFAGLSGDRRGAMLERMRLSAGLFPEPGPDELYLSKIGVLQAWRRRGFGRRLLRHFMEAGGQRRLRLDVAADNRVARRLYERCGFRLAGNAATADGAIEYVSMTCDTPGETLAAEGAAAG